MMPENQRCSFQPPSSLAKEVFVLRNEDAPKCCRPVQEQFVRKLGCTIFLSSEHIDRPQPQGGSDGASHVHVHIKRNTQRFCFR